MKYQKKYIYIYPQERQQIIDELNSNGIAKNSKLIDDA